MQMRDGKELKPCLSGRGVTKVFGFGDAKTVAVDHVDFDFHEGEFVSIVGESDPKTTLSKMLLGLISVTEGEIDFGNRRQETSRTERRKKSTGREFRRFSRIRSLPTICLNV